MQNSLSLTDAAAWIGKVVAALFGAALASVTVWYAVKRGRESYWQNAATALEKRLQMTEREKAEVETENAQLKAKVIEWRTNYDEIVSKYLRAQAMIDEAHVELETTRRDIRWLERKLELKPNERESENS